MKNTGLEKVVASKADVVYIDNGGIKRLVQLYLVCTKDSKPSRIAQESLNLDKVSQVLSIQIRKCEDIKND
jgi:hypothetical protein